MDLMKYLFLFILSQIFLEVEILGSFVESSFLQEEDL